MRLRVFFFLFATASLLVVSFLLAACGDDDSCEVCIDMGA
jgi:hypothetical protein